MPSNPDQTDTKIDFGSQAFKKYFFNTSWLFAEKIFRMFVSFLVGILIIRYLGPDQFGLLSYALSFVGLFAAIATLGLDNIVVRELIKNPGQRDELLGSVFYLRVAGAFTAIILISAALFLAVEDTTSITLILIISATTLFQSFYVVDFYFQAKVWAKYSAIVQFSALVIAASIKLILILIEADLIYFAVITSLEFFIVGAAYVVVYSTRSLSIFRWRFNKAIALVLLKDGWPLIFTGMATAVYMRIDQVMIRSLLDTTEVGYYAAAVKLTEAWYFVAIATVTSLFPAIINARNQNKILYLNRLQKLYDLLAFMSVAIAIPVVIFSPFIINIFLGEQYLPSVPILNIYIWAGVVAFLSTGATQFLIAENLTRYIFYRSVTGMIINIILNFILIPIMGITGSAIATVASYTAVILSLSFLPEARGQLLMMGRAVLMIDIFRMIREKLK